MTEYFVQPGTRVPLGGDSTTPPDTSIPRGNPELGDGGVVQVIDAEWKRRAGVARNLAAELADALLALGIAGKKNHYGRVGEGDEFHIRAVEFIKGLTIAIESHQASLGNLAMLCDRANAELTLTDDISGHEFST